jgi:lipocalin
MPSVADELRRTLHMRILAMSPDERIALTARLAESDLDLFCSARQVPRDQARRLLMRARQTGRRPSRVAQVAAT